MSLFALSLAISLAVGGPTDSYPASKVAAVNVAEASEQYQRTADLEAQFETQRRGLNEKRDALEDRIGRMARSLNEQLKPGTEEWRERRKQLAMLEAERQYLMESEMDRLQTELARSLRLIFDDIQAVVREIAEEKGIDVVVACDRVRESSADSPTQVRQQILLQKVLYWNPRVDLTGEVVKRLNARYEVTRVTPPQN